MSIGRVDVDLTELNFAMRSAARAGMDLRKVWRELRKPLKKSQSLHIKSQAGFDGKPWKRLAASTYRHRLYKGGVKKKRSTRGRVKKAASRRLNRILDRRMVRGMGSDVRRGSLAIYGKGKVRHLHQSGGVAGRKSASVIPARPYIYVDDELAALATQKISSYIAEQFEKAKK